MDPNANLEEQRELVATINKERDDGASDPDELIQAALRLTELVEALDAWISGGGFLPREWATSANPGPPRSS